MSWLDDYKSKLCSAQEAVQLIKSGDRVYYGGNAAIPNALVNALAARYEELENVQLTVAAFKTKAQRTVNTIYGPRVALPGEWILDLGEGCYHIATDEQVQRLRK